MPTLELIIMQQTLECGPFLPSSHQQAQAHMINRQEKYFGTDSLTLQGVSGHWLVLAYSVPLLTGTMWQKRKRASSYWLLTNWQTWISSSPWSRWHKVEKWGSLNKPIKKNNKESNSDGDPWLAPGSGCCSTTGISGARKGHASCCRALPQCPIPSWSLPFR